MLIMYGIRNCDTVKKARHWLNTQHIEHQFHDYRTDGLDEAFLQQAIDKFGWNALLNTRGTTWRKLDESCRVSVNNEQAALQLMLEMPAIIKRPLLFRNGAPVLLGFSDISYQHYFA